jgi:hypothetical protein
VFGSAGVSSVVYAGTGLWTIYFLEPMPDTDYAVLISSSRARWDDGGDRVVSRTTTSVTVAHAENSPSSTSPAYTTNTVVGASTGGDIDPYMAVAIFR